MAGELEITKHPKPLKDAAKEFILSLPSGGLIFHGTLNKKIGEIKEQGLIGKKWLGLHFYSFTLSNTNLDSPKTIKDLMQKFRNSIEKNVRWANIHSSFIDIDSENIIEEDLPAIVVARKPTDSRQAEYAQPNEFPHEYSYTEITPEDILAIVSLTPEEYRNIIEKVKVSKSKKPTIKINEEIGKLLSRKILRGLTQRNGL